MVTVNVMRQATGSVPQRDGETTGAVREHTMQQFVDDLVRAIAVGYAVVPDELRKRLFDLVEENRYASQRFRIDSNHTACDPPTPRCADRRV
jgi:hypothetical protein